jgi:hypothetical protein
MLRVVRPGGHVVFDVYNRHSVRYALKRLFGPRPTSDAFDEAAITTRFWSLDEARAHLPRGLELVRISGLRVATLTPGLLTVPKLGPMLARLEWTLMDSGLARFAGFPVITAKKL